MGFSFILHRTKNNQTCLDVAKEVKVLARVAPRGTERCYVITSRESPSLLSDDWRDEAVSSESLDSSMKRPEACSRSSSRTSSVMLSPTPSTPSERPSLPWTSSMLSSDEAEHCTDSVDKHRYFIIIWY